MGKKKKFKCEIGQIIAIPVPNGKYAFAKIFKDNNFGVYSFVSEKLESIEKVTEHEILFFQSATDSAVISGEWPIIGEEPFSDEESAWAPPKAAGVLPQYGLPVSSPMLSYKGELRSAPIEKLIGFDIDTFSQHPELFVDIIVNRLIKGDHSEYRVQP